MVVDDLNESELERLLAAVRDAEAQLAMVTIQITARIDGLAAAGRAAPGNEFLLGQGRWLRGRDARAVARRAELCRWCPEAADLLVDGAIGLGHVDVLARQTADLSAEDRRDLPIEKLLAEAARLPVDTFNLVARRIIAAHTPAASDATPTGRRQAAFFKHWYDDEANLGRFVGTLDAERYEAMVTAIDAHTASMAGRSSSPVTKDANLAARAIVELVTGASTSARRPHVSIVVGSEGLSTGDGRCLDHHAARRLLCDAIVQKVVLDRNGVPVDVGRRHRTATSAQWTALRAVHDSCAWSLCQRPLSFCQAHHIMEWENGGRTDLANLVPLCHEHHHRVHEGRWTVELLPDRSLRITKPDGSHHCTTDPPSRNGPAALNAP